MLKTLYLSLKYRFSKHRVEPIKNPTWNFDFTKMDKRDVFRHFKPNLPWPYDEDNLSIYNKNCIDCTTKGLVLRVKKIPVLMQEILYKKYVETMESWGTVTRKDEPWTHYGGAVHMPEAVNLFKPGILRVVSTLPQGKVVPAAWLYLNEGNGNILEVDMFETGPSRIKRDHVVFFSHHKGALDHNNYRLKTSQFWIKTMGTYTTEIRWNGYGTFEFYINGVLMQKSNMPILVSKNPYLFLTNAVTQPLYFNKEFIIESITYKEL